MDNNFPLDPKSGDDNTTERKERQPGLFSRWTTALLGMGLGESLLRASTNILSVIAILIVIGLVQMFTRQGAFNVGGTAAQAAGPTEAAVATESAPLPTDLGSISISRLAQIHTMIPSRPRQDITQYTVQAGDTIIGIADKFGLQPKTIFAANYDLLQDNPHYLQPNQVLRILPVDGVYWEYLGGIPFSGWADYFKVKPEDILNYPANHIEAATVGDPANANIPKGTWLIVPGGEYQYHVPGQVPLGITRSNPASAQVGGLGACPAITGGAIGWDTFVYPTAKHTLSGFDYSTKTNHLGIDLAGNLGDNVMATDNGVVVYAGWNDYGYGNMIMIDHGNGYQTLYAHLSVINVRCGASVYQGSVIGAAGSTGNSTGPHLHFETRFMGGFLNPHYVLP